MNTYATLVAEGYDYAKALIKHNIDPVKALRLMDDNGQRTALQSYIESLLPPPVPGSKQQPKADKIATAVARCARTVQRDAPKYKAFKNVRYI